MLDLVRLTQFAQRRGEAGPMRHLACFFKDPLGVDEHSFVEQFPSPDRLRGATHTQQPPREEEATSAVSLQRWPILTDLDRQAIARVLDRGVLSGAGAPEVKALEAEFAAAVGTRFCLALNSGTAALHIAPAAAGVGDPGMR